ncbi:MAG: YigZ family protein, partial [Bacteroidales bacterium]|nr:YigZ family protein [Bacteroidales bacterium]
QSKDLTNVLLIVVRYFGGTKLGVSGLITAYKTASRDALQTADILSLTVNDVYELSFEYPLMNEVMRVIKDENLKIDKQDFQISCKLTFRVRKNFSLRVYERFSKIHGVKITYLKTI